MSLARSRKNAARPPPPPKLSRRETERRRQLRKSLRASRNDLPLHKAPPPHLLQKITPPWRPALPRSADRRTLTWEARLTRALALRSELKLPSPRTSMDLLRANSQCQSSNRCLLPRDQKQSRLASLRLWAQLKSSKLSPSLSSSNNDRQTFSPLVQSGLLTSF